MPSITPVPYTTLFRSMAILVGERHQDVKSDWRQRQQRVGGFVVVVCFGHGFAEYIATVSIFTVGPYDADGPRVPFVPVGPSRSEEHTSELQSLRHLVCRVLLPFPTRRSSDLWRSSSASAIRM